MVLIFDNNDFRINTIRKAFRMQDFPMLGKEYEYYKYYTKPLLTVLINPKKSELKKYLNEKNTVIVVVSNKKDRIFDNVKYVIINENCIFTPEQAKEIIFNEYGFDFKLDSVNCITVADDKDGKNIYFGGKNLSLTPRLFFILRFFVYQRHKIFRTDEILEYLFIENHVSGETLDGYISIINRKSRAVDREKLILSEETGYRITDVSGIPISMKPFSSPKLK